MRFCATMFSSLLDVVFLRYNTRMTPVAEAERRWQKIRLALIISLYLGKEWLSECHVSFLSTVISTVVCASLRRQIFSED